MVYANFCLREKKKQKQKQKIQLCLQRCLRRGFCQPLGGQSVWAVRHALRRSSTQSSTSTATTATTTTETSQATSQATSEASERGSGKAATRPLVVLSAALDSNALFQDEAVGAQAEMVALTTALVVVDALTVVAESVWMSAPRQPLFAFFTGEAWQNAGSRRFVRDVVNFRCERLADAGDSCALPYQSSLAFLDVDLDNVAYAMHIDALGADDGGLIAGGQLYWHEPTDTIVDASSS